MEKIAVIGIGKLGLCFALQLEHAGYDVLGIDTDSDRVAAVNNRKLQSPEPGVEEALRTVKHFRAADQLDALVDFPARIIFIAVATPASESGAYDHRIVDKVLQSLYSLPLTSERKEVVIVCTTVPGYTDTKAEEAAEKNFFLSYNPEFIAQGNIMHNLQYPDQVLIGEADCTAGDVIEAVYHKICLNQPRICRMSRKSAEIAKLATNCFLTMKIAFANAIGDLAESVGAETGKILSAVGADSRIGAKFLQYGFGYGGPCFPRDNRALNFFAGASGYELLLSSATDEANKKHLAFQLQQWLKNHHEEETICFTSVTYKPGTVILEESQPLALAVGLANANRSVTIKESAEVVHRLRASYGELFTYEINT